MHLHGKSPRADRQCPHQRGTNAFPKSPPALHPPRLSETVRHASVPSLRAEAIALHLALNHIERVARQPQHLARQAAVQRNARGGDFLSGDTLARGVGVHHPLKGAEPGPVRLRLAQHRDRLPTVQVPPRAPRLRRDLADAVHRAPVQSRRPVRLRLQPDPDVLDGARDDGVGDAGEGA